VNSWGGGNMDAKKFFILFILFFSFYSSVRAEESNCSKICLLERTIKELKVEIEQLKKDKKANSEKILEIQKKLEEKDKELQEMKKNFKEEKTSQKNVFFEWRAGGSIDSPFLNSKDDSVTVFLKSEGGFRLIWNQIAFGFELGAFAGLWKSTAFNATPYLLGGYGYLVYQDEVKVFSLFAGIDLINLQHPQRDQPNQFRYQLKAGVDLNLSKNVVLRVGGAMMPTETTFSDGSSFTTIFWGGTLGLYFRF